MQQMGCEDSYTGALLAKPVLNALMGRWADAVDRARLRLGGGWPMIRGFEVRTNARCSSDMGRIGADDGRTGSVWLETRRAMLRLLRVRR